MEDKLEKAGIAYLDKDPDVEDGIYDYNGMYKAFVAGAEWQLANMWVRVEERLPEYENDVVFIAKTRNRISYHVGFYNSDNTWESGNSIYLGGSTLTKVVAWMPIPEFKKGE